MSGEYEDHEPDVIDVPGQELEVLPADASFARTIDTTERRTRMVNMHEASAVNIERSDAVDPNRVSRVFMEDILGTDDGNLTWPYIYLPADELHTARAIRLYKEGHYRSDLDDWLVETTYSDEFPEYQEPLEADELHEDDVAIAEQLVGRLFVKVGTQKSPQYLIKKDVPVGDLDSDINQLAHGKQLHSSVFEYEDYKPEVGYTDELHNHIFGEAQFAIEGQTERRIVSRSTLAIIDSSVQLQRMGIETAPMSVVLAQIYEPDIFEREWLNVAQPPLYTTPEGILRTVLARWDTEMGAHTPQTDSYGDVIEEIRTAREVNLSAIAAEYGHVTEVEQLNEGSELAVTAYSHPALDIVPVKRTGAELMATLNPVERQNLQDYADLILDTISQHAEFEYNPEVILDALVGQGILTHDIASVHAEALTGLVESYSALFRAQQTVQETGFDTSAIERTLHAKLLEFMVDNAPDIRRTQMLAPEIAVNLNAILDIVERTGLKGRSLDDITRILGQITTAQDRVVSAAFPALLKEIRRTVSDELKIELLNPEYDNDDRSGATLFVRTAEEASRIEEFVSNLLTNSGIGGEAIPIQMLHGYQRTDWQRVIIGSNKLREGIPEADKLPAGTKYYTSKTRGH